MNLRRTLLLAVATVLALGATSALADMDCNRQRLGGRVYRVCQTADGDLKCYICQNGDNGCAEVPCPQGAE